jgi:very-short-patch-repair endonuclease
MSHCLKCCSGSFQKTPYCRRHYEEVYQVRRQLRKEEMIGDYLEFYLRKEWSVDVVRNKQLPDTAYRPDFHFIVSNYLFIIEIDENQHRQYHKIDEDNRQKALLDTCHSFIRFNPDKYECNDVKHTAVWTKELKIEKPGHIVDIVKFDEDEFERRMEILTKVIMQQIHQVCVLQKPGNLCLVCFTRR